MKKPLSGIARLVLGATFLRIARYYVGTERDIIPKGIAELATHGSVYVSPCRSRVLYQNAGFWWHIILVVDRPESDLLEYARWCHAHGLPLALDRDCDVLSGIIFDQATATAWRLRWA